MLSFIKNSLSVIHKRITSALGRLFGASVIDESLLQELETLLLEADVGVSTTRSIMTTLKQEFASGKLVSGASLRTRLQNLLCDIISSITYTPPPQARIIFLIGVNGTGKTTCVAKLAHKYVQLGNRVLLVPADTFRAAARPQLAVWAERSGAQLLWQEKVTDPAAYVFQACQAIKNKSADIAIIDTAGRLHNKDYLMQELSKMRRSIDKVLPEEQVCTLLTIDGMLGQTSFEQARIFKEAGRVDGVILTKMDGSGKGGIIFSIVRELSLPVAYISHGETMTALKDFNGYEYVRELIGN